MSEAIEVAIYKLRRGNTIKDFMAANADMNAWFKRQPGFQ